MFSCLEMVEQYKTTVIPWASKHDEFSTSTVKIPNETKQNHIMVTWNVFWHGIKIQYTYIYFQPCSKNTPNKKIKLKNITSSNIDRCLALKVERISPWVKTRFPRQKHPNINAYRLVCYFRVENEVPKNVCARCMYSMLLTHQLAVFAICDWR